MPDNKKPQDACDSLQFSYIKLYQMKPQTPYIKFYSTIYNATDDTLVSLNYYTKCQTKQSRRTNYGLEYSCKEEIRLKGKLSKIYRQDGVFYVEIEPALLLSRKPIHKKLIIFAPKM